MALRDHKVSKEIQAMLVLKVFRDKQVRLEQTEQTEQTVLWLDQRDQQARKVMSA
jgi:hypothetical protein